MTNHPEVAGPDGRSRHRLDLRRLLPAFVVTGLDAASFAAVVATLPFHLQDMGATPLVFGIVLGVGALTQFAGAPWMGQLSDRFGRKKILLTCQVGAVISLLLLSLASAVPLALVAWAGLGLTTSGATVAAAYAADNSSRFNRRQAIGLMSAGLGLGGVIGPTLSGLLSDISLQVAILAAAALSLTNIVVTTFWLKDDRDSAHASDFTNRAEILRERVSFRAIVGAPVIRVLVIVLLCYYFAYGIYGSQLPNFLTHTFVWDGHAFGPKEWGYLLAADGAINIVVQLFVLRWLGRVFTERRVIALVFGLLMFGCLMAGLANNIAVLAIAVLSVSGAAALARPTFVAAISVQVPSERQGVVMGSTQSLVALTDLVTPVLAGFVVGRELYNVWIGSIIAIALAGAVITRIRLRPGPADPAAVAGDVT